MQHKMLRSISTLMILSTLFSFPVAGNLPKPPAITPLEDDITVTASASQTSDNPDEYFNPNAKQETPPSGLIAVLPNTIEPNQPRLEKMVDANLVLPGDTAHYSITLVNNAPQTTTYIVRDSIPENTSYIPGSATGGLVYVKENHELLGSIELQAEGMSIVPDTLYGYLSLPELDVDPPFLPQPCPNNNCDDAAVALSGFDFFFYGQPVSDLIWSTNGYLQVGTQISNITSAHQELPDPEAPNNLIAPLWMDLDLENCSSSTSATGWYRGYVTDGTYDYYVFEWKEAALKNDPESCFSFQVWIKRGSDEIWFAYGPQTGAVDAATVGIENLDGSAGDSYYFNGTGSAPINGSSLKVVRNDSQAIFTYDLLIDANIGQDVINLVEATNTNNGTVMQASTIVQVGERIYLPTVMR